MMQATLRAQHITKSFRQGQGSLLVLDHIDTVFLQGHTYALTGVSGAGKSTLLHLLAGLDEPSTGQIFFNETSLTGLTSHEHALVLNTHFGLVFQSSYLINELSVLENVMMPGLVAGVDFEQARARAHEMLVSVGLSSKVAESPATLSGGQQQRVAIVRALYNKPAFLCADEPTGNLDEKTGIEIVEFLLTCQREWKMGLIVSTHDAYVADRMETQLVLHNGKLEAIK